MKLLIIETGGTISGCAPEYSPVPKMSSIYSRHVDFSHYISQVLSFCLFEEIISTKVCFKDSRDIDLSDRERIAQIIIENDNISQVIIFHGTYTMPETGQYLIDKLPRAILKQKKIILTGSMYPWIFYQSDAPANIGSSLQALSLVDPGIYICMHQRLFDPRKVKKDAEQLLFFEKSTYIDD